MKTPKHVVIDAAIIAADNQCMIWPFGRSSWGYAYIRLQKRQVRVSRLICTLVHGPAPSPKHHAAHSCGKGSSGCISGNHLRWATPKENIEDQKQHGTFAKRVSARSFQTNRNRCSLDTQCSNRKISRKKVQRLSSANTPYKEWQGVGIRPMARKGEG